MKGNCLLCCQPKELKESHVWSRFGYKRYVSNQSKGGSFVDLNKMKVDNAQYQYPWLCGDCEQLLSKAERYASQLCTALERAPDTAFTYDHHLLHFTVSFSWRTVLFYLDRLEAGLRRKLKKPLSHWREFLVGKRSDVGPFSQHLFVVFGRTVEWHKGMGGELFPDADLVLSQIGPLQIVGLLERKGLSLADLKVWNRSKVLEGGGTMTPISEWREGGNITHALARVLIKREASLMRKLLKVGEAQGTGLSER